MNETITIFTLGGLCVALVIFFGILLKGAEQERQKLVREVAAARGAAEIYRRMAEDALEKLTESHKEVADLQQHCIELQGVIRKTDETIRANS